MDTIFSQASRTGKLQGGGHRKVETPQAGGASFVIVTRHIFMDF